MPVIAPIPASQPSARIRAQSEGSDNAMAEGTTVDFLTETYQAHYRSLLGLAALLLDDTASCEDVVQEAFIRVHSARSRVRDPEKTLAYLRQTVVNLSRSHFRRRALERRQASGTSPPIETPPDVETKDELWRALDDLPPRQRAALVLRYCEDLSEQQTAELLETTPKAVKSLVTRGLNALRQHQEVSR
jgi:RNA polymerase sigma-70 factor (sigma-E family)